MIDARDHRSVAFFDAQFRRAAGEEAFALNPFEQAVLPHLSGAVLDIGCGLGNLAMAAAKRGCEVLAVDASAAGVEALAARAATGGLRVHARLADARTFAADRAFDAVVSIGLLMFMDCPTARILLERWKGWVNPAGLMAVNVLVEGTTYLDMFEPSDHCLWKPQDLEAAFEGWAVVLAASHEFPAPGGTTKRFRTLIARKSTPAAPIQ